MKLNIGKITLPTGSCFEYFAKVQVNNTALRIVAPYTIFAILWIVFSDSSLERLGLSVRQVTNLAILKGIAFVAITSFLLYGLALKHLFQIETYEQTLSSMLAQLPDPVVVFGNNWEVSHINDATSKLFGGDSVQETHELVKVWLRGQERLFGDGLLGKNLKNHARNLPMNFKDRMGHDHHLIISAAPLKLNGSTHHSMVLIIRDVTELRRLERLRDEFLSNAAHELKTPITVIKTNVQLFERLGNQWDQATRARTLRSIDHQCDKVTGLIEEILDIAASAEGKLRLHMKSFDLILAARHVVDPMSAASGTIKIEWDTPEKVEVFADQVRIERVMSNLVQNAMKYSGSDGKILIKIGQYGAEAWFSVQDFGVGIRDDEKESIFNRFFRGSVESPRQMGGIGIGLNLSRQIIESHGGTIGFVSRLGEGSTFYFSLPFREGGR